MKLSPSHIMPSQKKTTVRRSVVYVNRFQATPAQVVSCLTGQNREIVISRPPPIHPRTTQDKVRADTLGELLLASRVMEEENFSLRWNDFEENISAGLQDLRKSNNFFDVTLLSEGGQVGAHKLILSACSSFFRKILVSNPHQHPLIYLKGVSKEEIVNLLNFMYCGEVNIAQAELSSFLAAAEDLKVKGLTNSGKSENSAVKAPGPDIKAKKTSKLPRTSDDIIAEEVSMLDVVQVKSEPLSAMTAAVSEKTLAAPDYEVDSGDFQYDEYQAQDTGFEDDFSNNILGPSKGKSFFSFQPLQAENHQFFFS